MNVVTQSQVRRGVQLDGCDGRLNGLQSHREGMPDCSTCMPSCIHMRALQVPACMRTYTLSARLRRHSPDGIRNMVPSDCCSDNSYISLISPPHSTLVLHCHSLANPSVVPSNRHTTWCRHPPTEHTLMEDAQQRLFIEVFESIERCYRVRIEFANSNHLCHIPSKYRPLRGV
jgi:hypothetical protein